jgi:hypothetical protein
MKGNYSRERDRWDRISGERQAAMRSPDEEWFDFGSTMHTIVVEQPQKREKGAPKRREIAAGGKAAKRARKMERDELARQAAEAELAEVAEEMAKIDQYGESWGGF